MWSELAQATEPAPQGWSAAGEQLLRHAEQRPDAFWPVVAVALPLLLVAGIGLIVVRWLLPAWREEKKADRESLVTALRQRGEEAAKDAEKDRELAKTQNEAIVQRIENKVERVTGELARIDARVERHGELLSPNRELGQRMERLSSELAQVGSNVQRILTKLGIGVVLAVVLCTPSTTASGSGRGGACSTADDAALGTQQPAERPPLPSYRTRALGGPPTPASGQAGRGQCVTQ